MTLEDTGLSFARRPESDRPIGAPGSNPPPVGGNGNGGNRPAVTVQLARRARNGVIQRDRIVGLVYNGDGMVVRRSEDVSYPSLMRQPTQQRTALHIMKFEVLAITCADKASTVGRESEKTIEG